MCVCVCVRGVSMSNLLPCLIYRTLPCSSHKIREKPRGEGIREGGRKGERERGGREGRRGGGEGERGGGGREGGGGGGRRGEKGGREEAAHSATKNLFSWR